MDFCCVFAQALFLVLVAVSGVVCYPYPYPVDYSDIGAVYSQYHAQDELGQYSFGYSGPSSTKHEQKTTDGVTRGTYSYVDPLGRVSTSTSGLHNLLIFRPLQSIILDWHFSPACPIPSCRRAPTRRTT